ncbi:hypothetical protein, partial [Kordia sp.]|uniref:hypothetical protein n=1 Tax=Kordia sp. TaxID=1965332 RepID=UPI0025BBB933
VCFLLATMMCLCKRSEALVLSVVEMMCFLIKLIRSKVTDYFVMLPRNDVTYFNSSWRAKGVAICYFK